MEQVAKAEILQIIDSVSRERGISKNSLLEAMEQAIQVAGRKKYGHEHNILCKIDPNTGKISLYRVRKVVEDLQNILQEILLEDALLIDPQVQLDQEVLELLPPIDLGRVAAQITKQVIVQKVNEIERQRQYEDYRDRQGDILNGVVKRVEFGNIIVDVGRAEAMLRKNQQIRGEMYKVGDRVKAYVQEVKREDYGAQIFLSRTDEGFLHKLLEMEVPEIYDGLIEVKAIVRDPGSKAKVALFASDILVDVVGSCVGPRGSRIKAITNELGGEKIDVIKWDQNVAQFIINAMKPAEISRIVFDENNHKVEAIVPQDQLSLAIGRSGQNVRLASKITGWLIDVMTEEQESKRRSEEFVTSTNLFVETLDVEEVIGQLLAAEGYATIEQVAYASDEALAKVQGFTIELAQELKNRAIEYLEEQNADIIEQLEQLGVEQELLDILALPPEYILKLAEYGVKTLEDLAEITTQEFSKIVPTTLIKETDIENLINHAKKL